MTRYRIADPVPEDVQKNLHAYDPLLQRLLYRRGIREADAASQFLAPDYDQHLNDPFLMTDMDRAVDRVLQAIQNGEHIIIYSDYDCDGIPGGVLLHDFFTAIGHTAFENYIPHRHEEGYGFNEAAVDTFTDRAKLIITVDCGITDTAATANAKAAGIDVIITDHHEVPPEMPAAYAILNPKRDDAYPFPELCGSGVAFKLVQGLIARGNFSLKEGWEKWWLDVVGLATIADMVPLVGENRVLAYYGLQVLHKSRRPGLQHLLKSMRVNQRFITEDDIGFMIGPRINAASRMDDPEDAFRMLATTDEAAAGTHARRLEKLNNERKGVVAAMVKDIRKRIANIATMQSVVVMGSPNWRPALVGLAANSLVEEYKRPVFLWGRDGKNVIKGSCRSDGSISVVELMHAAKETFIEYGGHHFSGGFAVQQEHIHQFEARINDAYQKLERSAVEEESIIDNELSLADVTRSTYRLVRQLAPFGEGNPKPLFRFKSVTPESVSQFGKGKDHTRATFAAKHGSIEAIGFFKTPDQFSTPLEEGVSVDLIAHIEESFFMNRPQIRLRIVDVVR